MATDARSAAIETLTELRALLNTAFSAGIPKVSILATARRFAALDLALAALQEQTDEEMSRATLQPQLRAGEADPRDEDFEELRANVIAEFDADLDNIHHSIGHLDALLDAVQRPLQQENGCPCLYGNPCHPRCTCVMPLSSSGCERCCQYGSDEQRAKMAEILIARLTAAQASPGWQDISTFNGEDGEPYLVRCDGSPFIMWWNAATNEWRMDDDVYQVTHWMALPPAPGKHL